MVSSSPPAASTIGQSSSPPQGTTTTAAAAGSGLSTSPTDTQPATSSPTYQTPTSGSPAVYQSQPYTPSYPALGGGYSGYAYMTSPGYNSAYTGFAQPMMGPSVRAPMSSHLGTTSTRNSQACKVILIVLCCLLGIPLVIFLIFFGVTWAGVSSSSSSVSTYSGNSYNRRRHNYG